MKTTLKIVGILILLLIVAAIALPFIFRGKLADLAREEINKNLNAKVGFGDISLSLIRSFPDFTLGIEDLSVVGIDTFQNDTLAYIPKLDVTVDLFSVIKGSGYEIKRIGITNPSVLVKILEDGTTNYDIVPETPATEPEDTTPEGEGDAFQLQLKDIRVTGAYIRYIDESTGIRSFLKGTSFALNGDLTADETSLQLQLDIDGLDLDYGGIPYFSNTRVKYTAGINADLKNEIYTLEKNALSLNDLYLVFEGSVATVGEDLNIVLSFNTPKTDFKTFLSLVPALYTKDFSSLQASGKLGVDGFVKGVYNETTLPAFSINIEVENGMFRYPDLPQSVTDVRLKAAISNSGGDEDNTVIDLSTFHLKMGSNPVDMAMLIKTPVSDPDITGKVRGMIDLGTVKDFYPLEADEELKGTVTADITLQGRLSAIENEDYESFTALGSLLLQNISYTSSYTGQPLEISTAQLNFSPQYLDLVSFACTIGENDISASGKITNYLGYALSDATLAGTLTTRSEFMDLNSLMESGEAEDEAAGEQDSTAMGVIEVPGNIDFEMNSSFSKLIYDTYNMENVNGRLAIKDKKLIIKNLSMNLLDGEVTMSGEYSTADLEKPSFDFNLDIRDIDIQQAYTTFGVMEKYAPIAAKAKGSFSSKLTMRSVLDQEMMPVYETMNGGGKLETSPLQLQGINTLDKIADAIKYEPLKNLALDRILLLFEFIDGKILVEPFDINQKNFNGKVAGWTGLDETIDYTMNLNIPRASFGQAANDVLNNLVNQANSKGANFSMGETVSLDVLIGGTITNPEIRTSLKETGKTLVEDVKKQVEEEIQKQKEELTKQAREEAQKILDEADKKAAMLQEEARKQADNIRKNANDAAKKVRDEAEKQAKKIEDEGKKKGFLAEAAAKESAKQVRKEADRQANNLVTEADKQARAVTDKADQEAARIKQEAQKEADRILGKI